MIAIAIAMVAAGYSVAWIGIQNIRNPQGGYGIQSAFTCVGKGATPVNEAPPSLPSGWRPATPSTVTSPLPVAIPRPVLPTVPSPTFNPSPKFPPLPAPLPGLFGSIDNVLSGLPLIGTLFG